MHEKEFNGLLDEGNVLRELVFGRSNMRMENNLDVFREFNITTKCLNAIRACVKGNGDFPEDDIFMTYAQSGKLRHFSDALGGFDKVDKALDACKSKKRKIESMQLGRDIDAPLKDGAQMYDWRTVCLTTRPDLSIMMEELCKEGFHWVSMRRNDRNDTEVHHFRRIRTSSPPS